MDQVELDFTKKFYDDHGNSNIKNLLRDKCSEISLKMIQVVKDSYKAMNPIKVKSSKKSPNTTSVHIVGPCNYLELDSIFFFQ